MTIILPNKGAIIKDGKHVYDYLPYVYEFTNRESYLLWVKDWKETYKTISENIRHNKQMVKNLSREGISSPQWHMYQHKLSKHGTKEEAREYMKIRMEAKALSKTMRANN